MVVKDCEIIVQRINDDERTHKADDVIIFLRNLHSEERFFFSVLKIGQSWILLY